MLNLSECMQKTKIINKDGEELKEMQGHVTDEDF